MILAKVKFFLLALLILPFLIAAPVFAQNPLSPACQNANSTGSASSICNPSPGGSNPNPAINIINDAANIIAIITGIGAVIMIILGGFTMVTSGSNAETQAAARRRIIYASVGLVVVALAWSITRFITDKII